MTDATLRTDDSLNLSKIKTDRIVMGAEQKDQLIAQRFTMVTVRSWYASWTWTATGAKVELHVVLIMMLSMHPTKITQRYPVWMNSVSTFVLIRGV